MALTRTGQLHFLPWSAAGRSREPSGTDFAYRGVRCPPAQTCAPGSGGGLPGQQPRSFTHATAGALQ
jgi:hypothetical protein